MADIQQSRKFDAFFQNMYSHKDFINLQRKHTMENNYSNEQYNKYKYQCYLEYANILKIILTLKIVARQRWNDVKFYGFYIYVLAYALLCHRSIVVHCQLLRHRW